MSLELSPEVKILNKDSAPTVYTDGMAQMMFGFPVSKLYFASSLGNDGGKEDRRIDLVVAIPTVQLLQMCTQVMNLAKQNATAMTGFADMLKLQLDEQLDLIVTEDGEAAPQAPAATDKPKD